MASSATICRLFSFRTLAMVTLAVVLVTGNAAMAFAEKYAAIVIDARTGETLYSKNANSRRYPASLTKMMTLYMTFEALASGRISKSTPVVFSAKAASEPPTKLGVRKGGSITVETAILAMVTKSANDAATAMGELLGGSEANFARLMTAKARQLGMNGTVFRNAHGLPDPGQFTTARDMAILSIALREHFPQYYAYFSQRSFMYGKQRINGHNRLLGRIKGVDGIKTGYTRASGFNLASSVKSDGRMIVAVVMGGRTGRERDDHMASLIHKYLPKASRQGGGQLVAKAASSSPATAIAKVLLPKEDAPTPDRRPAPQAVALVADEPAEETPVGADEARAATVAAYVDAQQVDPLATASVPSGSWAVQVASSPDQSEAKAFLERTAKRAPKILRNASSFTVAFDNGGTTYYRARFGGFASQDAAVNTCKALKRLKIDCYAVQQ